MSNKQRFIKALSLINFNRKIARQPVVDYRYYSIVKIADLLSHIMKYYGLKKQSAYRKFRIYQNNPVFIG